MPRILVQPDLEVLCESALFARTHVERARGLLGREPLAATEGLVFEKTPQIHTFGMKYPIDVVFCDRDLEVIHVARNVRPRRISRWVFRARYTIEMKGGTVPGSVDRGTRLVIE